MFMKIKALLVPLGFVGLMIASLHAEDALRDGNRNPTILFDQGGQPKRVSTTSPLPVTVSGEQGGASQVTVVNSSTASIPVRIVGSTVPVILVSPATPIPVGVTNQISSMSVTVLNPSTFTLASITNSVLPVSLSTPVAVVLINPVSSMSVTAATPLPVSAVGAFPIISSTTLNVAAPNPIQVIETTTVTIKAATPIPISVTGALPVISTTTLNIAAPSPIQVIETATVTVKATAPLPVIAAGIFPISSTGTLNVAASAPLPVMALTALPTNVITFAVGSQSHVSEHSGSGTFTLITPAAGKAITIRGVSVTSSSNADVDVRFSGGIIAFKAYLTTQMGPFVPILKTGAINESVQGVVSGTGGGTKITFMIDYDEN